MACNAQAKIIGTPHCPHFNLSHGKSKSSESKEDLVLEIYQVIYCRGKL
jgi:hypothetical protein